MKNYYLNLNFFQVLQSALLKMEKKSYQKRCKERKNCLTLQERRKTLKKEKETQKMRKSQRKTIFSNLYLFIQKNFYFVRKRIGKTLYWYSLLEMQLQKTNAHIDMHRSCRCRTSIQNTWN